MCIGVPVQVLAPASDTSAWCDERGERVLVDMMVVGPQPPGTWVLAFQGAAREVMSPADAALTLEALKALGAALAGDADIDRFFPDLAGREPELPEHLRRARAEPAGD
jgi:hydrogenase expression/formation protein HypC